MGKLHINSGNESKLEFKIVKEFRKGKTHSNNSAFPLCFPICFPWCTNDKLEGESSNESKFEFKKGKA